ncbi:MAG: response regulator transcription factor [Bacteroidia bacterium]|nr:response regulator transcription factor [Bacteroidia bacterium]
MSQPKRKILLAEDDRNFGAVLKDFLELNDYKVTLCEDGNAALAAFNTKTFDICILDVMMPGKDGFTLAKEIQESNKKIPYIFLTAKSLKDDMLHGFKLGADDYLTKPFDSEVLLAKITAIINRKESLLVDENEPDEFTIGKYNFDYKLRELSHNGAKNLLSPKESDLLKLLAMKKNDVLDRDYALRRIWKESNYFTTRSMDVYVAKIRKYLKEDPALEIVNIHGKGFRLIER